MKPKNTAPPILDDSPFEVIGPSKTSPSDAKFLREREEIIRKGHTTFLEVGQALMEIRDYCRGVLYKERYGTFEDYCRERWDFGRAYAYRLIGAAQVLRELSPMGDTGEIPMPTSERQIRALSTLDDPKSKRDAWKRAVELSVNGEVTSTTVAKAVREKKATEAPSGNVHSDPIPKSTRLKAEDMATIKDILKRLMKITRKSPQAKEIAVLIEELEGILQLENIQNARTTT